MSTWYIRLTMNPVSSYDPFSKGRSNSYGKNMAKLLTEPNSSKSPAVVTAQTVTVTGVCVCLLVLQFEFCVSGDAELHTACSFPSLTPTPGQLIKPRSCQWLRVCHPHQSLSLALTPGWLIAARSLHPLGYCFSEHYLVCKSNKAVAKVSLYTAVVSSTLLLMWASENRWRYQSLVGRLNN